MIKCSGLLHPFINDLGHLITNAETRVVDTFSVRDISRKQNVKFIPFLVGVGVGLDISHSIMT